MTDLLQHPLSQYYFSALLAAFPVARVFLRAGFPFWYAGLLAAPFVGFILCLAALSFRRWGTKTGGADAF